MAASAASSCSAQSQSHAPYTSLVTHDEWTRASTGSRPVIVPHARAKRRPLGGQVVEAVRPEPAVRRARGASVDCDAACRPVELLIGRLRFVLLRLHDLEVGDEGVEVRRGEIGSAMACCRTGTPPGSGCSALSCSTGRYSTMLIGTFRSGPTLPPSPLMEWHAMHSPRKIVKPRPDGTVARHVVRHDVRIPGREVGDLDRLELVRPRVAGAPRSGTRFVHTT